ncbi:TetR/AcrR family transcriptional regulator [Flavimarina sp. Hel_I_48]|uniref:TetR/AcrR family transcriptional regulator n=1 Tax=Flavimarina sp. Hel_I_48 TaxID=1392488 RepID=UPI0004DED62E|nr:TetR/AcrR family transcriptional regulator [Flavimarina sp. Hel_I_48]
MKEEILESATDLFLNLGFKSVTMDDIATKMGISKKTIYDHYSHKTDLIHEVCVFLLNQILYGVDAIVETNKNPIEELYAIKKFVLQHLKGDKSSAVQQLQKYYPKVCESMRSRQYNYMQERVYQNLTRGIEQGLFRRNLNIDFVARIYFIGITGIKDSMIFPTDKYPAAMLHEHYLEYHLRGITTVKGREILNKLIKPDTEQ